MQSLFSKIKSWFSKGSSPFRRSPPFRNWFELLLPLTYGFKIFELWFSKTAVGLTLLLVITDALLPSYLSIFFPTKQTLFFYEFRKFYYEMIDLPSIYSAFKGLANANFPCINSLKVINHLKDMRSQISRPHTCKWASTMGTRPPICTKEGCVYTPKWHYDYKKN